LSFPNYYPELVGLLEAGGSIGGKGPRSTIEETQPGLLKILFNYRSVLSEVLT